MAVRMERTEEVVFRGSTFTATAREGELSLRSGTYKSLEIEYEQVDDLLEVLQEVAAAVDTLPRKFAEAVAR